MDHVAWPHLLDAAVPTRDSPMKQSQERCRGQLPWTVGRESGSRLPAQGSGPGRRGPGE